MKSSHIGESGEARMVDVGGKAPTARRALASGTIRIGKAGMEALSATMHTKGRVPALSSTHDVHGESGPLEDKAAGKGDVLGIARLAGIMAAKRVHELIPLCHQIPLDCAKVDFEVDWTHGIVTARSETRAFWRTGVEMEALSAVSAALLTIYDMLKSVDKGMEIGGIVLVEKDGGKSGPYRRGV